MASNSSNTQSKSRQMELMLAEDVPSLGKQGELVKVRPGYARNFLLPQGLATVATSHNKMMVEKRFRCSSVRSCDRLAACAVAGRPKGEGLPRVRNNRGRLYRNNRHTSTNQLTSINEGVGARAWVLRRRGEGAENWDVRSAECAHGSGIVRDDERASWEVQLPAAAQFVLQRSPTSSARVAGSAWVVRGSLENPPRVSARCGITDCGNSGCSN